MQTTKSIIASGDRLRLSNRERRSFVSHGALSAQSTPAGLFTPHQDVDHMVLRRPGILYCGADRKFYVCGVWVAPVGQVARPLPRDGVIQGPGDQRPRGHKAPRAARNASKRFSKFPGFRVARGWGLEGLQQVSQVRRVQCERASWVGETVCRVRGFVLHFLTNCPGHRGQPNSANL